MAKKTRRKPTIKPEGEFDRWARDLAATIGKAELRIVLRNYRRLANDAKLSKRDREIAGQQAKALSRMI